MIEAYNVSKRYYLNGGKWLNVFQDVNFKLLPQEKVGFLGLNGSGKTTICKLISNAEPPSSGRINITSSISWPIGVFNCLAMNLTGYENIKFICLAYNVNPRKITEQIEHFAELEGYMDIPINAYSNGMRAKLAFFIAFSLEFDFYICDEITSVGDASFRQKASDFFENIIKDRGLILCSHSKENISKNVDYVYIVHNEAISEKYAVKDGLELYNRIVNKLTNEKN